MGSRRYEKREIQTTVASYDCPSGLLVQFGGKKSFKMVTPRYVSVSSKHILSTFYDGNRVGFSIASFVELGWDNPAVNGGSETQKPLGVITNSRYEELHQMADIKFAV